MYAYTYTHPPRNLDTRAQLLPHITHGGRVLWHLTSSGAPEAAFYSSAARIAHTLPTLHATHI